MSTLTNFIGCLKNNIRSKKDYVDVSFSLLIEKCLAILLNEGFILGYCLLNAKTLRIFLKYFKGRSVINDLGCISLPGFRKYWRISDIIKNYNKSILIILSTPSGVFSDKTIIFKRRLFSNASTSVLTNYNNNNSIIDAVTGMQKNFYFSHIDQPIKLSFKNAKLTQTKLNDVSFHKFSVLKGFYRPKSLFNKISRRHYIRNRNIRLYYRAYITKSYVMHKSIAQTQIHLKNLTFFKFKRFFSSFHYLMFRKSKNFIKCFNFINEVEFYSIFYFIFYTKQLAFTGYRFRFSLYLKYINHLIKIQPAKDIALINVKNKLNMGGEPLLYVK